MNADQSWLQPENPCNKSSGSPLPPPSFVIPSTARDLLFPFPVRRWPCSPLSCTSKWIGTPFRISIRPGELVGVIPPAPFIKKCRANKKTAHAIHVNGPFPLLYHSYWRSVNHVLRAVRWSLAMCTSWKSLHRQTAIVGLRALE